MRAAIVSLALGYAAAAPSLRAGASPSGSLLGLFQFDSALPSDLTLLSTDPLTGFNRTLADTISLGPLSDTFPAFSCKDESSQALVATCASADGVYSFDAKGAQTLLSPLPPYDETDPLAGLACAPGAEVFYITSRGLSTVGGGEAPKLQTALSLSLTANKVVVVPTGGTDGAALVVIADTASASWTTIDAGDAFAVGAIKTSLTAVWDVAYSAAADKLIALYNYNVYAVDASTGATSKGTTIPGAKPSYQFLRLSAIDPAGQVRGKGGAGGVVSRGKVTWGDGSNRNGVKRERPRGGGGSVGCVQTPSTNAPHSLPPPQFFAYFDFYNQHVIDAVSFAVIAEAPNAVSTRAVGNPQVRVCARACVPV